MSAKHEWSAGEIDVLARAVVGAPSVHNIQPWRLELPDDGALVFERTDLPLPHHDPGGRDRSISCGAAITNLELGMRVLALSPAVTLLPDPRRPDLVVRMTVEGRRVPSDTDLHRYSAIARRRSYRHPFAAHALSQYAVRDLIEAASAEGVQVAVVRGEDLSVLADLLEYAAVVFRQDRGYQRELSLWTIRDERSHRHGTGMTRSALPGSTLPWAGLVRPATAVPDREILTSRLEHETLLVFLSPSDDRIDHVRAGMAMQRTWLAAVDLGLVAAVQTQPLHLSEVRSGLTDKLGLSGHPQLLMRVGHPTGRVSQSPRRHTAELVRPLD